MASACCSAEFGAFGRDRLPKGYHNPSRAARHYPKLPSVPPSERTLELLPVCMHKGDEELVTFLEDLFRQRPKVLETWLSRTTLPIPSELLQESDQLGLHSKHLGAAHKGAMKGQSAHHDEPMSAKREPQEEPNPVEVKPDDSLADPDGAGHGHGHKITVDDDEDEAYIEAQQVGQAMNLLKRNYKRDRKAYGNIPVDEPPVVQFEATQFFASEDKPYAELGVLRIGNISKESCVNFQTRDASAIQGVKYIAKEGRIKFEAGERRKVIQIETINDDAWDATLEFKVALISDGLVNARRSEFLKQCRVKILDNDTFPTNRYQEACLSKKASRQVSSWWLLKEYFMMNLRNATVRKGIIKSVLADQMSNIYFVMELFLNLYLIDFVLCETCNADDAPRALVIIVLLKIIPYCAVHQCDYSQLFWKVGGTSRMTLQANLLRKFLNYDDDARAEVADTKLVMAIMNDVIELAGKGFGSVKPLITNFTRLILVILYQLIVPQILGKRVFTASDIAVMMAPVPVFSILMGICLRLRNKTTTRHLADMKDKQEKMLGQVRELLMNFPLVRDYRLRSKYIDVFQDKVREFNGAATAAASVMLNNRKFAPWLTNLTLAAYIYYGGMQVAAATLSLGEMLNTLAVYNAVGGMFGDLYNLVLSMQETFGALDNIIHYMNLPVDANKKKVWLHESLKKCNALMKRPRMTDIDPFDQLCIECRRLRFEYRESIGSDSEVFSLRPSSFTLPQGGIYLLVGPAGDGKETVLSLLGEVMLPLLGEEANGGLLMLPGHLRSLHVTADSMFLEGTLLYNLTFGCLPKSSDASLTRVLKICAHIGLPEKVLKIIREDKLICNWKQKLSSTECSMLHLARAFIANPEVLYLHKPTLHHHGERENLVFELMTDFVHQRGLYQDPDEFHTRRPRTVVLTAHRLPRERSELIDAAFVVTKEEGVMLVNADQASPAAAVG
eukprot:TRINITY_DN47940_c0_g1_i1.p1 TRINITY_DN47940_c0_g1~~TRINITY_DN47940_c0_g1_i1.p1  ORF type:complete len:956 (-),score=186.84 TRINITY_DN47940_c0_g1_i1:93-2960(-)